MRPTGSGGSASTLSQPLHNPAHVEAAAPIDPWAEIGLSVEGRSSNGSPTRSSRSLSALGSIRDLAAAATGDILGSASSGVRDFEHSYGSLVRLSRIVLCLPGPDKETRITWKLRLAFLWALLVAHVLACVSAFVVSFVGVGFGSVGMSNVTDTTSVLKVVTSFDFTSQVMALATGLLCAWWFLCTREYAQQMLGSVPLSSSATRSHPGLLSSVGFGWDFFLSYPGPEDAALVAEELRGHLQQLVDHSGVRYPTGVFLDKERIPRELAMLHEKSRRMGGPACPPGPRTGFHIFISYRRKNAADARALKQALAKHGYRIFMDLDPDGLQARLEHRLAHNYCLVPTALTLCVAAQSGDFQAQLERVLDDVPVVLMHCSKEPPGEFARIANEEDWVRLEIRRTLEAQKLLIPVVASGQLADIGQWGFRHLPQDCRDLQRLNATELNDGQYEASVLKVHNQIEAQAEKLVAGAALLGQQDKVVTDHWMKHFRSHLEHSSVIVIMVTTGAIETIRDPDQNRLDAAKLLLEWGHALLLASQQQQREGWAEMDKQSVIVVPVFVTGHQGDRPPHPDIRDECKLDFSNFDSIEKLVERVLGPASAAQTPAAAGGLVQTKTGRPWDQKGFWQQFSNEEPEWFKQQLVDSFSTSEEHMSTQGARTSFRFRGVTQKVDPRSTVQGIFRLAQTGRFCGTQRAILYQSLIVESSKWTRT